MKILYHHRTRFKDGQYVHIAELIYALRKLGHEVIVVAHVAMENAEFGDDLRVSPLVPLAEHFIGKGMILQGYNSKVQQSRLLGANRAVQRAARLLPWFADAR